MALVALVAGVGFATPSAPAAADPTGDPGNVQQLQPPRPSAAALDAEFTALVSQIPGMHIINTAITDNGGRMVCAYWTATTSRTRSQSAARQSDVHTRGGRRLRQRRGAGLLPEPYPADDRLTGALHPCRQRSPLG